MTIGAISALGLPVTWDVVRLGWEGVGSAQRLLCLEDVRAFADLQVTAASDGQLADVAELCMAGSENDVREILERLSPSPPVTAMHVWRAVLLDRLLRTPQASAVDTLAELTGFWGAWGDPADSPHVVQGRGNSLSPAEYYTEEVAKRAVEEHRRWLDQEVQRLRQLSPTP